MKILTIRTDKPEAEVGLFDNGKQLAYETWYAHRELSVTLHQKIADLLAAQQLQLSDLEGIVAFGGPGSFTGLRIGLTVGNALAYSLHIPITAAEGEQWIKQGVADIAAGKAAQIALPNYGAPAHITQQKK